MSYSTSVPFVVGQWVRGDRFYGRRAELSEILQGARESVWLLATRRIGKTSLLKQLEYLTASGELGYVPLFWDFQGADEPGELHLSFHDALLDAEERLAGIGVEVAALDPKDLFSSLARVRRRVSSAGSKLLLLCDEVEELIQLYGKDPSLLSKLRRSLQSGGEVRSVLASTIRLWSLAEQRGDTSPFLHGFTPPLVLATLTDDEARALLRQEHLAAESRPQIPASAVESIRESCDNHPYLLQLMGKRYLEVGDVALAEEQVATDEMVSYFFAVDFEMLSPTEQQILRAIGERSAASSGSLEDRLGLDTRQLTASLHRLEDLGFLRRDPDHRAVLANHFFQRWLKGADSRLRPTAVPRSATTPSSQRVTEMLVKLQDGQAREARTPQELLDTVYGELHQLARRYMSRERPDHTLQATALVHEAYLRLADQSRVDWRGRTHFLAIGAKMMRRILIDHARGRHRDKRGADWLRVSWAEELFPNGRPDLSAEELLDLDQAIQELSRVNERQARIVELRFFGGLTAEEAAQQLGISKRTAEGDWAKARDWLYRRLSRGSERS